MMCCTDKPVATLAAGVFITFPDHTYRQLSISLASADASQETQLESRHTGGLMPDLSNTKGCSTAENGMSEGGGDCWKNDSAAHGNELHGFYRVHIYMLYAPKVLLS